MMCLVAQLCPTLCDSLDYSLPGSSVHGDSPGKSPGVGCHALLQGIFQPRNQTQVSHIAGGLFTVWATREAQCMYTVGEKEQTFGISEKKQES